MTRLIKIRDSSRRLLPNKREQERPPPAPTSPRLQTLGQPCLALSVWPPRPGPIRGSSRANCSSPRSSHSLATTRWPPAPPPHTVAVRQHLGRHDAHHVPARVHQRPARIARLHRQADLEIARVIRRARQRRDFPRDGRAPAPWAQTPATRCPENPPWPPCRPVSPCGWRRWAAGQTARPLLTTPDHSPHQPSRKNYAAVKTLDVIGRERINKRSRWIGENHIG